MRRCLFTIAVGTLLVATARGGDPLDLLRNVTAHYDTIETYELEGTETVVLSGDCTINTPITVAAAPSPLSGGITFHSSGKQSKACMDVVTRIGGLPMRSEWSNFRALDVGVKEVHELKPQDLKSSNGPIHCIVLEAIYDDYYQKLRHFDGPVRLWIDAKTLLIRRVEFSEKSEQGPRAWSATIDRVTLDEPPATRLPPMTNAGVAEIAAWIGKPAPDFELHTSDGDLVRLAALRGKVVVLDFWATWCGACLEEIPPLEKLQREAASEKMVILGISDEDTPTVSRWREENHRPFRTLVGAKETSKDYGVSPIPAMVVIDPRGIIVRYVVGFESERQLRGLIGVLVSN